jgi:hypothetical protein
MFIRPMLINAVWWNRSEDKPYWNPDDEVSGIGMVASAGKSLLRGGEGLDDEDLDIFRRNSWRVLEAYLRNVLDLVKSSSPPHGRLTGSTNWDA